jgi:hypothetical protein
MKYKDAEMIRIGRICWVRLAIFGSSFTSNLLAETELFWCKSWFKSAGKKRTKWCGVSNKIRASLLLHGEDHHETNTVKDLEMDVQFDL